MHSVTNNKSKNTNFLPPNRYQLLKHTSENIKLVLENFQETDIVRLPGNVMHRNRNALSSINTRSKRPSVVINK